MKRSQAGSRLEDRREIGLEGAADGGIGREGAMEGLHDQRQGDDIVLEPGRRRDGRPPLRRRAG